MHHTVDNAAPPAEAADDKGDDAEGGNISWQARSILVNLRAMPVNRLYGASQQQGRKVNEARRPMVPTP